MKKKILVIVFALLFFFSGAIYGMRVSSGRAEQDARTPYVEQNDNTAGQEQDIDDEPATYGILNDEFVSKIRYRGFNPDDYSNIEFGKYPGQYVLCVYVSFNMEHFCDECKEAEYNMDMGIIDEEKHHLRKAMADIHGFTSEKMKQFDLNDCWEAYASSSLPVIAYSYDSYEDFMKSDFYALQEHDSSEIVAVVIHAEQIGNLFLTG